MIYHYSTKLNLTFGDAVAKITGTLQEQGFGIITTFDLKATLKQS